MTSFGDSLRLVAPGRMLQLGDIHRGCHTNGRDSFEANLLLPLTDRGLFLTYASFYLSQQPLAGGEAGQCESGGVTA